MSEHLFKTINKIKEAYIKNWEDDRLAYVTKVAEIIERGIPTPTLSVSGMGTQEIRFTKYLAYFLDSQKSHGINSRLLREILKEYENEYGIEEQWYETCNIFPELYLGSFNSEIGLRVNCYCDIGIIGNNFGVLIEQKILSDESKNEKTSLNQLKRYSYCIEKNPKFNSLKWFKIYLTPTGKLPKKVKDWIPIKHSEIIIKGIKVLQDPCISSEAKGNIKRLLLDLSMGPYEESEEDIQEIARLAKILNSQGFRMEYALKLESLISIYDLFIKILMEEGE